MTPSAPLFPFTLPPFFLLLFLALVFASPASAQDGGDEVEVLWGHWSGGEGDSFLPMHPASMLCVQAAGPVHVVFERGGAHPGYRFEPGEGPHCRLVMGGILLRVEEAPGPVDVLVVRAPPRVLQQPGVTPLPDAGHAVRVQGVTAQGELTIAVGGPGLEVVAFAWPSLESLPVEGEGPERVVQVPASGDADGVVLVTQTSAGQSLLRWSDSGWYPGSPNVGQALVPTALALMVSLFRGGAGGSFVRPPRVHRDQGSV